MVGCMMASKGRTSVAWLLSTGVGGVLSGTLKGSPQSPAGVPGSSCHCTVWEQGTLTPPLSVGKNTSLRMGEQDLVGNSQVQGWEEEPISPRPFVFREGAVPRCSLSEHCVGF